MTGRQLQIAEYIDAYWEENWTCPTVREIAVRIGAASAATAHWHLRKMVRLGLLEEKRLRSRVLYRVPKTS